MQFQLTILGSNSAIPAHNRFPSAQVLNVQERLYLIDCGEGTQLRLSQNQIRKHRINQIFISHLHGDHVFGLSGLLTTMSLVGRESKLQIFSPPDLREMIESQLKYTQGELAYPVEFIVVDTTSHQLIFSDQWVEVYSIPLIHRIPATGYLFRERRRLRNIKPDSFQLYDIPVAQINGIKAGEDLKLADGSIISNKKLTLPPYHARSFAYCSDTLYSEAIIPIIQGVDLLYHESTFLDEKAEQAAFTKHSTAKQAATIAAKAKVNQLLLGHYSSRYKDLRPLLEEAKAVFSNTLLGLDGQSYEVPLTRMVESQ